MLKCMSHVYHRGTEVPTHSSIPPPRLRYEKLILNGSREDILLFLITVLAFSNTVATSHMQLQKPLQYCN